MSLNINKLEIEIQQIYNLLDVKMFIINYLQANIEGLKRVTRHNVEIMSKY